MTIFRHIAEKQLTKSHLFEVKCREGYLITARNMNFLLQSGRVELAYEATQFKVQISNLSIYLYRIYSTELIRKDFVSSHINSYVEPKTILLYCKSTVFGWSYELICEGKKSLLTIHTLNRIEIRNDNVSQCVPVQIYWKFFIGGSSGASS